MDWYTSSRRSAQEHFPDDWELFLGFLAVTSVNSTVKSNMTLALKAYSQYEQGKPFQGFLKSVIVNLHKVIKGEEESFGRTLDNGIAHFDNVAAGLRFGKYDYLRRGSF